MLSLQRTCLSGHGVISHRLSVWRSACRPIDWGVRINVCVPPAARQGPIAAATGPRWQAPEHQQAPHQLQPLERPQGTAEACRTSIAQSPASVMVLAAVSPVGKSPLVFVYPRAWKSTRKPTRPDHIWAGAEAVGWGYPRRQSPDIPAGRGELEEFRPHRASKAVQKICHFFISKDQWPPSSTDLKPVGYTMWSVLEKEACSKPHKKIWSVNDRRSQKQSCVPPSETSQKVCCHCAGSRRPLWLAI